MARVTAFEPGTSREAEGDVLMWAEEKGGDTSQAVNSFTRPFGTKVREPRVWRGATLSHPAGSESLR